MQGPAVPEPDRAESHGSRDVTRPTVTAAGGPGWHPGLTAGPFTIVRSLVIPGRPASWLEPLGRRGFGTLHSTSAVAAAWRAGGRRQFGGRGRRVKMAQAVGDRVLRGLS